MSREIDFSWHRRAQDSIAHGALTNSKRPECFVFGEYPTHLKSGDGCFVKDTQGNSYIDFVCGLGANLLGYNVRSIREAIEREIGNGVSLSLSSTLEVEFAEKFKEVFPFADRIRILKSGSEGCSAAIRIARATTGRDHVHTEGYNGWHDEFLSQTPPAHGVPRYDRKISRMGGGWMTEVAAVIIEPVITDYSSSRVMELQRLRAQCDASGTVLIFDETITGLRFPGNSYAQYIGIIPDIIVTGKALANGMPISVVGGKKEIMESDYFVSSTFAGERLTLASAIETLRLIQTDYPVSNIWEQAQMFMDAFNAIAPDVVKIVGYPTRGIWQSRDDETKALFMQESVRAGILVGPSYFWCQPHADLRFEIVKTFTSILTRIKNGEVKLDGEIPKRPFTETVRKMARDGHSG